MAGTNFIVRHECPACGSGPSTTIYRCKFNDPPVSDYLRRFYSAQGYIDLEKLRDGTFILEECSHCGLIFQKEILCDQLMEELYEKWIDPDFIFQKELDNHGLAYYAGYAQEIMQIIAYLNAAPHKLTFLDFGMGWGKWAQMARACGCECYGVELSERRIAYARANGIRVISQEEIPKHRFDFINTDQVMEHVPKPLDTLLLLKNSLNERGIIKVCVPNGGGIKKKLKAFDWSPPGKINTNPVSPLEHINCFSRSALARMGSAAGLREFQIPLLRQYAYTADWHGPIKIVKNIIRPLYRGFLKQGTYVLFQRNL